MEHPGAAVADCGQLPKNQGDALSIIISGISGEPSQTCTPIDEVEHPTDPAGFGTLASNGCLEFRGVISGVLNNPDGSPNPDRDIDVFVVDNPNASTVNVSFTSSIATGRLAVLLLDGQGNLIFDCTNMPTNCQTVVPNPFLLVLAALDIGNYAVQISDASAPLTSNELDKSEILERLRSGN
jgi:hypothetical protein